MTTSQAAPARARSRPVAELLRAVMAATGPESGSSTPTEAWWRRHGRIYGWPVALARLWSDAGLEAALAEAAAGDAELAEHAFRVVACAALEPASMREVHSWSWSVAWLQGGRTTRHDVKRALALLARRKDSLEEALFLHRRDLFNLAIQRGFVVAAPAAVVLFREEARPVAFEWLGPHGVEAAVDRLTRRFDPHVVDRLEEGLLGAGLRQVFGLAQPRGEALETGGGLAVAGFLALVLLAELRRRLAPGEQASRTLKALASVRAVEVSLAARRYLVRQPVRGDARQAFRALGLSVPRRVRELAEAGAAP